MSHQKSFIKTTNSNIHTLFTKKTFFLLIAISSISILTNSTQKIRDIGKNEQEPQVYVQDLVEDIPFTIDEGTIERVYDWSTDRCANGDSPDMPPRAFVDSNGRVHFIAGAETTYQSEGDNLTDLVHAGNCEESYVFKSDRICNPRQYNGWEWLVSPYTLDGTNIYSLVHNEYHGWSCNNCNSEGEAQRTTNCWWGSISQAYSTNGGDSYSQLTSPNHSILSSPTNYDPDNEQGWIGFYNPSNIVEKDGYYYFLVGRQDLYNSVKVGGTCLARSSDISNPKSWKLWDGNSNDDNQNGFTIPGDSALGGGTCATLPGNPVHHHLSYNAYLGKYISIMCHWGNDPWAQHCWYSLSDDLINWTPNQQLGNRRYCMYGTLIQPGDPTRNFEQTDRSPWLYFIDCGDQSCTPGCNGFDKDVYRARIRFNKTGEEGKHELLDLQFNEKRGNKTLDSSFYTNDGTLSGSQVFMQSGSDNFLHFNGSGWVTVADDPSLDISSQVTIEARIKTSMTIPMGSYPMIIRKEGPLRNYGLFLASPGLLLFSLQKEGVFSSSLGTKTINDGKWHYIKIMYNDKTGYTHYFIDGNLDISRYHGAKLADGVNNSPAYIGAGFTGDIDSLTVFNYLTEEEPYTPPPTDCTEMTFSPGTTVTQGQVLQVNAKALASLGVDKVRFYYAPSTSNYCEASWKEIIGAVHTGNGWYQINWNTTSVPAGDYLVAANVYDQQGSTCTGNPGPPPGCGINTPCSDCNANVKIEPVVSITPTPPPPTFTPTPTPVPGDANDDGRVTIADYIIWLNHYGMTTGNGPKDGDFDNSGSVGIADYIIWLNNYGT